jgi:hypothetical protein
LRALALLLLIVQGVAGVGVAWAHAAEPPNSTVAFEAAHDSNCLVVHNELRCTTCQFAGAQDTPPTRHSIKWHDAEHFSAAFYRLSELLKTNTHLTAPARGPPALLA